MRIGMKPYLDQIDLTIDEDGIRLDFSAVNTALDVLDGGAENDNCWKMAA
ncbi:hypothetical protein AGMMS50256_31750 [Betaproteobacteria bacterium]|nr:hypothetical protein AGMMS50256_31750 [Betaproteobacteria bacterium]